MANFARTFYRHPVARRPTATGMSKSKLATFKKATRMRCHPPNQLHPHLLAFPSEANSK